MKTLVLSIAILGSVSARADDVTFTPATSGSATLTIQGPEAEKLFFAMNAVKKESDGGQNPPAGFSRETLKPFSGLECVADAADRLPTQYTCVVKFSDVKNGIPDSR